MKRRTLVQKMGAAGIAMAAVSGPTAAAGRPSVSDLGIERELDVASVEGEVTLDELLEPHERAALPADVDPSEYALAVAPEVDAVTVQDCCPYCCSDQIFRRCLCGCCVCDDCACDNTC